VRELFLHIGLHKTGTSYLQKMALENRGPLLAAGLGLAPFHDPGNGTHHPILAALERDGPEAVLRQVAAAPGERILVSAEDLAPYFADRSAAEAFRRAAEPFFRTKVFIVLRRQDFLKESVFAEEIKRWYAGDIMDETSYDYDHDRRLRQLEDVFGRENLAVALYNDQGPNDLVGTLLAAAGIELDRRRLKELPPRNVTVHRRKRLLLARVPKSDATWDDPQARAAMAVIRRAIEGSGAIADDGVRWLMSPGQRHELVARHAAGNAAVVARYRIPDARGFLELPARDAPWQPPRPLDAREILAVARATLAGSLRGRGPLEGARMAARTGAALVAAVLHGRRLPRAGMLAPAPAGRPATEGEP
jgi:hypothetical protein